MSMTGPMICTTLPVRCAVACLRLPYVALSSLAGPGLQAQSGLQAPYVADAPETTSMISRVIAACRTLFM